MKKTLISFVIFLSILSSALTAQAFFIVDTGPSVATTPLITVDDETFSAGRFEIAQAYNINSILGWFRTQAFGSDISGTLTTVLYGDTGVIPDVSNEIYTGQFNITPDGNLNNWYGVSGINLDLLPGKYWISFEKRAGDTYLGYREGTVLNPLELEAAKGYFTNNEWRSPLSDPKYYPSYLGTGYRVDVVPEPATVLLFGTGLVGVFLRRRKA